MNTRRFVLHCTLGAAAIVCMAKHVQAQQALEAITKAQTVRIGVPADMPPFGFKGDDGQLRGLDIDIAKAIAGELGVKAELVPVTSANRVPWLQERKIDVVVSTLGRNPDREKVIDFSVDYSSFYLSVFGPKSLAIPSPAALSGKTIAVTKGSIEDQELQKVAPPDARIQRFDDNAAAIAAYVSGKTQLVAAAISVAAAAAQHHPGVEVDSKLVLKDSKNYVGVPKGEAALLAKVNGVIESLRTSGELRKLSQRWFSRGSAK